MTLFLNYYSSNHNLNPRSVIKLWIKYHTGKVACRKCHYYVLFQWPLTSQCFLMLLTRYVMGSSINYVTVLGQIFFDGVDEALVLKRVTMGEQVSKMAWRHIWTIVYAYLYAKRHRVGLNNYFKPHPAKYHKNSFWTRWK